jgi:hypothetical protein
LSFAGPSGWVARESGSVRLRTSVREHAFLLRVERQRQRVREVLGADATARAWADGQKMSLAETIAYAKRVSAVTPAE